MQTTSSDERFPRYAQTRSIAQLFPIIDTASEFCSINNRCTSTSMLDEVDASSPCCAYALTVMRTSVEGARS
jgi:hypothetical protein